MTEQCGAGMGLSWGTVRVVPRCGVGWARAWGWLDLGWLNSCKAPVVVDFVCQLDGATKCRHLVRRVFWKLRPSMDEPAHSTLVLIASTSSMPPDFISPSLNTGY